MDRGYSILKSCFKFTCILLLAFFLVAPSAPQQGKALLLYKSSEEAKAADSRVALNVSWVLDAAGYTYTYHDVDKGLPAKCDADLIVSFYNSPKIADPEAYVDWMAGLIKQGKKVIILGNFGAHTADGSTWMTNESLNRFFYPFGLKYGAAYTGDTNLLKLNKKQAPGGAPNPLNYYMLFSSTNPANDVLVEVERTDLADSKSALVVRTPFGAMAQEAYVNHTNIKDLVNQTLKAETKSTAQSKRLLGLYKSSEKVDARSNFIARFVAPTLFDLGYGVDYYDIDQGLPSEQKMAQYDGLISWYITPEMKKAGDYIDWLAKQIDAKRRVIILGNFGAFAEDVPSAAGSVRRFLQSPEYNKFFYPFGLEFRGAWTPEKKSVQVSQKNSSVMTWLEPNHVGHYYWIRSVHPDNAQHLTVTRSDLQDGESAVVVSTPAGGLALESYVLGTDPSTKQPRLHIDLAKFLQTSLTLQGVAQTQTKPALQELQAKAPLPAAAKPILGGNGIYPGDVKPIKRRILGFYRSSLGEYPRQNQNSPAQMVLEHLGLLVDYHDLDDPNLPSMAEMEKYRGILLWVSGANVPNAQNFDNWLVQNVKAGRKLALLGDYHIRDKETLSLINPKKLYAQLGLYYDALGNAPLLSAVQGLSSRRRQPPRNIKIVQQKPGIFDFERKLDFADSDLKGNWHLVKSVWPESEIGLTVAQAAGLSDIEVICKNGGACIGPFPQYWKNEKEIRKDRSRSEIAARDNKNKTKDEFVVSIPWRLDPFRFFSKAFQIDGLPRQDVTTLNGSRIYYSHIDGDAFGGISLIDRSSINGEIILNRVLKTLPLPVTVSYVTQDVEKRLNDRYSRELGVAQEIFRLPNIEPASHTFSHPFNWQKGDLTLDPNSPNSYTLVRKEIDIQKEIAHSLEFIDKLCPPNKRCEILLWSGKCNPKATAIDLVRRKGLPNMNGGESTYDAKRPFITGIAPLIGTVGDEVQYHVSAAGDFYYTKSWTGDYNGMKDLVDYFNRTESPRRLRSMNVYYHFYLGEREPGLQGLKVAYDDVLRRKPAPMFASEYTDILKDFVEGKVGMDAQGRYWIANSGAGRTVRFDSEARNPDLNSSQGVIGFNRINGSLYVHLDGSGEARIALSNQANSKPYLVRFTQRTKNWKASPNLVEFTAEGQGPAYLEITNLVSSSPYRIETNSGEQIVRTDANGTLAWEGFFGGYRESHPVRVRKVSK